MFQMQHYFHKVRFFCKYLLRELFDFLVQILQIFDPPETPYKNRKKQITFEYKAMTFMKIFDSIFAP